MPIPSVNCAFVLDDYRFRVRGSPHTIIHFLFFSLLSDLKFFLLRFGIRSTSTYSVQFSLLQSNSVYFWFILSSLVQLGPFFPFWSISRRKWAFAFFAKTFQQNTPYLKLGVSMFDPTCEPDTNTTRVFSGQGWALMGLGHKRVDSKTTR